MKFQIDSFQNLFSPKRPIISRMVCFIATFFNVPVFFCLLGSYLFPLAIILFPALLIYFVGMFNPNAIPQVKATAWYLLISLIISTIGWLDIIFIQGVQIRI